MRNNKYCSCMEKIHLNDTKKEEIYKLMIDKANQQNIVENTVDSDIIICKPKPVIGNIKIKAIPIVAMCLAVVCIITFIIVYTVKNLNDNPFKPAEGISYNSGTCVTDINGNTICLDAIHLSDSITIDNQIYYANEGKFLIISGDIDITYSENNISNYLFDETTVFLQCTLSDVTQTVVCTFRYDLLNLNYDSDISGIIYFVFEVDNDSVLKIENEINNETDNNYSGLFLMLDDFKVYGTTTAYASVSYKFDFKDIIIA